MVHNNRCAFARTKKEKCRCSCRGEKHGQQERLDLLDPNERLMTEDMGGEIAQFIKEAKGKEFDCFGVHKRQEDSIHVASEFWGYPHDGGLEDASGNKWWVFIYCDNPAKEGFRYQTSFAHFKGAVDRAKREREYQKEYARDFEDLDLMERGELKESEPN